MKPELAQQLLDLRIDPHSYGKMPKREDIFYATQTLAPDKQKEVIDQWSKLNLIRKNLKILDRYIAENKGKTLIDWLKSTNEHGISQNVLNKIGQFNDDTKGISMYFLRLQQIYDDEEEQYDALEGGESMPDYEKSDSEPMRNERKEKRKDRREARKLKLKDFEKDDKGYLLIDENGPCKGIEITIEKVEPKSPGENKSSPAGEKENTVINADGKNELNQDAKSTVDKPEEKKDATKDADKNAVKSARSKIGVSIALAGAIVFIAAVVTSIKE
jgi:hypothetical protein